MKCELKLMLRGFIYFIKHITIYYILLMAALSVLFCLFIEYTPWYIGQVIVGTLIVCLLVALYMFQRDEC
jgi:hypothetical protein